MESFGVPQPRFGWNDPALCCHSAFWQGEGWDKGERGRQPCSHGPLRPTSTAVEAWQVPYGSGKGLRQGCGGSGAAELAL